ncbi:efflux transporter outer membrane subunit [Curvibacter sp. APW13]|uniref:efflux transporter outer membrane subunit n=1 Tax=Curvibacter sp. APW13 TaxID=3077236 RepID=UPI0028DFC735|nr:efflux transporter outer membrane subunit [Curvibacter sp. APW13]MDT8989342.1 efflux transporter outer membrane subunit [Curvibacter sp. APW13]
MNKHPLRFLRAPVWAATCAAVLSGCAITMPAPKVDAEPAAQWQAPLPHGGAVSDLSQWWQAQGDATLVAFIEAAQQVSPGVAQALARIESARANQAQARGTLLPQVNAQVAAQRGVSTPGVPVATTLTGGLQAAWELDLVGANRAVNKAAQDQVQGSQALWHDARVSVAAEVANVYYGERHCRTQLELMRKDAASRAETAKLVGISAKAGFVSAGDSALAQGAAADSAARVTQQATSCDMNIKALVALTGLAEPDVRQKMAEALAKPAQTAPFSIAAVPAQTVAQRPDVFAAERDVAVASAQVGAAKAQRYPRLTLQGSIGALRTTSYGVETNLDTWSFGPLALTLPIFDGGQRVANVAAAQANYTQAVSVYKARVRNAVREVEEALLTLQSTAARKADVDTAVAGFTQSLSATQTRHAQGLASLMELEDARRQALSAQSAQAALDLERRRAWIALYRASGGGFQADRSE